MNDKKKPCAWCHYARMKTDICGIYCTGGFENPDGTCDHFKDSRERLTERTVSMDDKTREVIKALEEEARLNPTCRLYQTSADLMRAQATENAEMGRQLAAAEERRDELDDALRDMVLQYCSYNGKLDHEFMNAGENAFNVLDLEYGAPTETLYRGPQEAGEVEQC